MVRGFFLLSHFSVEKDFEFPKKYSHLLSVPLTLKYILIHLLVSTLIVSMMVFRAKLLSELMVLPSTHHVTKHLTCRNKLR